MVTETALTKQVKKMQKRIRDLEKALSLPAIECRKLHHSIKHRHEATEPCPAEKFVWDTLYAEDINDDTN